MGHKHLSMIWPTIILIVTSIICTSRSVQAAPDDQVKKYKQEFLSGYGFFITDKEAVSYYEESLGVTGKENKIFRNLKTIEDVDKFIEVFLKVRDPNPNTPENEFKNTIDQRIQDIQNEIFAMDVNIPGTRFSNNGGLKGDLAHVYLLYGVPNYGAKLSLVSGINQVDLMVWYYLDVRGKPLFRFLFYEKNSRVSLFKHYMPILSLEDLVNPLMSPLKEISNMPMPTAQELYDLWMELERQDPEGIFRAALLEFSSYSDVVVEGGNVKHKRLGALDPPEPAILTAARSKPTVLGQPDNLAGMEFISNSYNSFIPAKLKITKDNRPSFTVSIGYADVDWEIKGQNAESILNLRISFQNKTTKKIKEFLVRFTIAKTRTDVELRKRNSVVMEIPLDNIQNFAQPEAPPETFLQLINQLEPGTYVVNIDLEHAVTKKRAGGWREEITIK